MNGNFPLQIKGIYPNPATNTIALDFDSLIPQDATLTIVDALGNEKIQRNIGGNTKKAVVDISSIRSGVYMARIISGNTQVKVPFIKKD